MEFANRDGRDCVNHDYFISGRQPREKEDPLMTTEIHGLEGHKA